MGAQGVGPQGITEADPTLIQAEEKLIGQAEELVVLVDLSKFLRQASLVLCGLDRVATIITDDGIFRRGAGAGRGGRGRALRRAGAPGELMRAIAVVDIGKTTAKLALVDRAVGATLDALTRPNRVLPGPPYPHADVEGLWRFILEGLGRFAAAAPRRRGRGDDPRGHGGAVAGGGLALPVLDYEHDGPDATRGGLWPGRPDFAESLSPRLPAGLNLGGADLLAGAGLSRGLRADRGDPDLSAVLGLEAQRRDGERGDLARLPHRPLGAGRGTALVAGRCARAGPGCSRRCARRPRCSGRCCRRSRRRPGSARHAGRLRHPRFERLAAALAAAGCRRRSR